jgi:hypothetical protein
MAGGVGSSGPPSALGDIGHRLADVARPQPVEAVFAESGNKMVVDDGGVGDAGRGTKVTLAGQPAAQPLLDGDVGFQRLSDPGTGTNLIGVRQRLAGFDPGPDHVGNHDTGPGRVVGSISDRDQLGGGAHDCLGFTASRVAAVPDAGAMPTSGLGDVEVEEPRAVFGVPSAVGAFARVNSSLLRSMRPPCVDLEDSQPRRLRRRGGEPVNHMGRRNDRKGSLEAG